ncbi:MAG: response regulator [Lachnospiraceae bacterium]|nr:response regulator [Lachnospiraceae bacterium]
MSDISGNKIVLITYQSSVIVTGLENKLKVLGYAVTTIGDDASSVADHGSEADLFIYYLPVDILDDPAGMKQHDFGRVIDIIKDKKLILIGENRNHDPYMQAVPVIGEKVWIDKPVDHSVLEDKVSMLLRENAGDDVKRSILIVDDDPTYAKMVRGWIADRYNINIVTAGMHAIKFLTKNKVDLILLDYEMPVVDGPQVLEMLRSDPELADIPVVFLTGINSRESIERVLSLKPSGYILKNTTKDELVNTLKGIFKKIWGR